MQWMRRTRPSADGAEGEVPPAPPVGKLSLARPTLAALRVGVLVLDERDQPVLVNPAAREMGLVRQRGTGEDAHTVLRERLREVIQ